MSCHLLCPCVIWMFQPSQQQGPRCEMRKLDVKELLKATLAVFWLSKTKVLSAAVRLLVASSQMPSVTRRVRRGQPAQRIGMAWACLTEDCQFIELCSALKFAAFRLPSIVRLRAHLWSIRCSKRKFCGTPPRAQQVHNAKQGPANSNHTPSAPLCRGTWRSSRSLYRMPGATSRQM